MNDVVQGNENAWVNDVEKLENVSNVVENVVNYNDLESTHLKSAEQNAKRLNKPVKELLETKLNFLKKRDKVLYMEAKSRASQLGLDDGAVETKGLMSKKYVDDVRALESLLQKV